MSGLKKAIISLQADMIYDLFTHSISQIRFSKFHILSINRSLVSDLAQSLDAEIASAAVTTKASGYFISTSKWCHSAVFTITSCILCFLRNSAPALV